MGQIDKKLRNQLFKVAVDYIYQEHLVNSQGELAKKIGISESALSRIMNDKKFVGDDTLRKMNEAFGGIFNMAYFRGDDPHCMLMEDLLYYQQHPEERLVFDKPQTPAPPQQEPAQPFVNDTTLIMSKMFEQMLKPIEAAHANEVAALQQQIAAQNETIASLRQQLALMSSQLQQRQLRDWPFETGVADKPDTPRAQV
jgi:transcriptional regulator with XRE-family HTH domain